MGNTATAVSRTPPNKWVPPNRRYKGSYHWNAYWGHWDKVLDVQDEQWVVQKVNLEGEPVNRPRKHSTPLDPGTFAIKPFDVKSMTTFKKEQIAA